jgi:hypothetical protein
VSSLERRLNKPIVVLVVGVVAVVLNVQLYYGIFLPRMTPLIAHISPIGTSLLDEPPLDEESIPPSKSPLEPKPHPGLVVSQVLRDLLSRVPTHLQQTHLPAHLLSFRLYLLLLRGSTNKRWSEGRGLIAASPHLHALIHRSAWNARSRKCRIAPILCGRVLM